MSEENDVEIRAARESIAARTLQPTDRFGPKACLLEAVPKGREEMSHGRPHVIESCLRRVTDYHLCWTIAPTTVLVIKKFRDVTVTRCFKTLITWLHNEKHMTVYVESSVLEEEELADDENFAEHCERLNTWSDGEEDLKDKIDFIICLGGDGTLLYASTLFPSSAPPLIGFHLGSLGFLTPFPFQKSKEAISTVIDGAAKLTLRLRLHCKVQKASKSIDKRQFFSRTRSKAFDQAPLSVVQGLKHTSGVVKDEVVVLNELVIDRGPSPYLSNLHVYCNDNLVTVVQGDGLIVATPTGSTAYAAAAGSSMVHPSVPAIILAPICPHSLSFRPIVVPSGVDIRISVSEDSRHTAWASFDGRNRREIKQGESVLVTTSKWCLPCVTDGDHLSDWFRSLSQCLNWNYRLQQKGFDGRASSEADE